MRRELRSHNPESMYWHYLLHASDRIIHVGINQVSEGHFLWTTSLLRPGVWGKQWPSVEYLRMAKPFELSGNLEAPTLDDALTYIEDRMRDVQAGTDHVPFAHPNSP